MASVDAVSETMRTSWDAVFHLAALEFLNVLSYRRDKQAKEKAEIERWKRQH